MCSIVGMFKFVSIFFCILHIICFATWISGQSIFPEDDNSCYTSKKEPGICINVKECSYMVKLLINRSKDPEVIKYLQESTCGFSGRNPLICCPNNNNLDNINNNLNSDGTEKSILPSRPHCGLSNVTNSRIVGGVPAKLHEFPFMVILGYRNKRNANLPQWLCGGSLITNKHILTAAHCTYNRNDLYLARVGELTLYDEYDGASPEDIPITGIKMHEGFSNVEFTNDIAILTLERQPKNAWVWPICLPIADPLSKSNFIGDIGIITGWGSLFFDGPKSSTLQVADVPVQSQQNCQRMFGSHTVIDDRIICAGWPNGTKDTCQGDSGGPLMYGVKEGKTFWYYQIGIVSYGFRCAEKGYPGVFTRITNYIDWIKKNVA